MKKLFIIFLILSFATLAYADRITIRKLGGINTRTNEFELQDFEATDMSNFVLDTAGSITERNLFKKYTNTSVGSFALTNLYKFYKSSDTGYLIASGGTTIYKASSGTLTNIGVTSSTVTSGTLWSFETFTDGNNELVYGVNNDVTLSYWNGTNSTFYTAENASNAPATNCNLLKKHKSRLWAAGSKTFPYRIYYSSLNNGYDWNTSGGSMDLPSYEKIMALEVLSDTLFVFTRTSIYAVLGDTPNEFTIQKTRSTIGTHATKSVVAGDRLIFFLNKAGVFAFDGDTSTSISETIQPTIDSFSSTYLSDAAGLYDKRGRFWLAYTSQNGSYNDKILVYDTVVKQWYILDGANFSSFFKAEGGTDKGELYAGCSNPVGFLWQLQTASSLEQVIHSTKTQLQSGVTDNMVFFNTDSSPIVEQRYWGHSNGENPKLILHLDGSDGATTTTDISGQGHTFTFVNSAQLDTAYKSLGTASLLFNGTTDYVTSADSDDWDTIADSTGNKTIDFWVRHTTTPSGVESYISQGEDATNYWTIKHTSGSGLKFYALINGIDDVDTGAGGEITDTAWHHIAFVKKANEYAVYKDGTQVTYVQDSSTTNYSGLLNIGRESSLSQYFKGNIDEIRITNDNAFNASPNSGKTDKIIVPTKYTSNGTLTSQNLQINASAQSSLGVIQWNESLPSNTDIQFTTRTGTTNDTVYDTWTEPWVSTSTTILEVSDSSVWESIDSTNFTVSPTVDTTQTREVLFYETDKVAPNALKVTVNGAMSQNDYAYVTIPPTNLSTYTWIGFWLKSPVTDNTVVLDIGEVSGTSVGYITANTVNVNTWEYHYWPISNYTSTDIDGITWLKLTYLGDGPGTIYLGEIAAYDFLNSGETITSTPNDWIQYKAILGTTDDTLSAKLINSNDYVVSLSYSASSGDSESSLTSSWTSKTFDFGQPNYNKFFRWVEITGLSNNATTNNTVNLEYEVDGGARTGTVTQGFAVTGNTTKVRFYFPAGTYGKDLKFTLSNSDVDDSIRIDNATIEFSIEGNP